MKSLPFLVPAFILLATCCTPRVAERVQAGSDVTTLSAYMADATKTGYTVDESARKAVFNWLAGDLVDILVNTGSFYDAVPFAAREAGPSATFDDGKVADAPTVSGLQASYPSAVLSDWGLYPSKYDGQAVKGGYSLDWGISGSDISITLPGAITLPADNPLAIVPLFGVKDAEGGYAFSPMTAVLAIPVTGITSDMDFISISSENAALSGEFALSISNGVGEIAQSGAQSGAAGSLELYFSGISGDYTFYFPVPSGTIPAGLTLKCGQSSDPDNQMTIVTKGALTLTRGRIAKTQAIPFASSSIDWQVLTTEGRFLDDFLWGMHSSFTNGTYVPVTIERSLSEPSKYRIANPYAVACKQFGYTPYTSGIEADQYLEFEVADGGAITFSTFRTGMEDKDSGGKPMQLMYPPEYNASRNGKESKVLRFSAGPDKTLPVIAQLGCVYCDPNNTGYFYSRDGSTQHTDRIHIIFSDEPEPEETWTSIGNCKFIDNFFWTNNSFSAAVSVEAFRSDMDAYRYRMVNPYPVANAQFGRSGYDGDDYFYFSISSTGAVTFEPLVTGMTLTMSGALVNRNFAIKMPSDVSATKVISGTADDPLAISLGAVNYDSNDASYFYTRATADLKYIYFPGYEEKAVIAPYKIPMLAAFHNPVANMSLPNGTLQKLVVKITSGDLSKVTGLRLWQNAQGGWMDSDYLAPASDGTVTMTSFTKPTVSGNIDLNFWVQDPDIASSYTFDVQEVVIDGISCEIEQDNSFIHLFGVKVNTGGDAVNVRGSSETVSAFRIPALVTSNAGTLIAAYDVRYAHSGDLQADIDVGMKRSTDGGKTWSDLQLIMDMGTYGGLPQDQNGIGDPCLLVDEKTGRIFCFAVWTHGHEGGRALSWAGTGFDPADTPQYMMVYSDDDGLTWCDPINITTQVKQQDWLMTFQGPGRGFTMSDGTLVVPMQHQTANRALNSGIMYSKDHGATWHAHNYARATTSECTAIELNSGAIMLNMRDETGSKKRAVYVTTDLGQTWTKHSTDGTIIEPTCEACLLKVKADKNILGKDIVLFSNPHHSSSRTDMTIQASLDDGNTWTHSLLVDGGGSWGYSCLTMIDSQTVGILYESSKANILFQAVPLTDIIK